MIRRGEPRDLPELTAIYNHYVERTAVTFDLEPFTVAQREPWLASFGASGRHQLFVAEEGGRTLGWACSRPFRERRAYDPSIETSVYLAPDATGRRLGTALYEHLFAAIAGEDVHRAIAGVTLPNDVSVALHRRFGFSEVGVMREVGRKHGRWWDVLWMDRAL